MHYVQVAHMLLTLKPYREMYVFQVMSHINGAARANIT
jgi:hypothetical protein